MLALTIVELVLLVLALVYIVALLRSHADILRRLTALENGTGERAGASERVGTGERAQPVGADPTAGLADVVAANDISGVTLSGDSVKLSLGPGSPATLLAFLSSGCGSCGPLWEGLHGAGQASALAERVVIVTHGVERESPTRVRRLAPPEVEVLMATAAWEEYAVPASPHFVLTDGAGGISGRGSALSWPQLLEMIDEARADAREPTVSTVQTTAERAARAEQALGQAGIGPGHSSLYPSTAGQPSGEGP